MTTNGWWIVVGAALLAGAGLGAWIALKVAGARHRVRLRRSTDELQTKFSAAVDQLRAAQVRAQTELEQTRNAYKRQLAGVAEEPRAATARAEERLRGAYDEIDRLRRDGRPAATSPAELTDGFAATRPMRDGL